MFILELRRIRPVLVPTVELVEYLRHNYVVKKIDIQQDDASTRVRVSSMILHNGPVTAAQIAERLNLTPAAVRRHLDQLLESGLVQAQEVRTRGSRGRGRPAKAFKVADAARDKFGHQYDVIASDALSFLRERHGDAGVIEFTNRRTAEAESRYEKLISGATPAERGEQLAEALSADGYAAEVLHNALGAQLCQHHCPVAHVAAEHPEICEAETQMFSRLLGSHVQRLATIAHGDGVCTTHIPQETKI